MTAQSSGGGAGWVLMRQKNDFSRLVGRWSADYYGWQLRAGLSKLKIRRGTNDKIPMPTKNVLIPVDGSANSLRALKFAAERFRASPHVQLMLLNVQPAMPSSRHVRPAMIKDHQQRMSEEALGPARSLAGRLGVMFDCYMRVGNAAEVIASFATRTRCAEIIMGTRGLGGIRGLMLGSVTTKVIHLASVPVTLVK